MDHLYMRRCLQLAANGRQNAKPNPMVGAVIVAADGSSARDTMCAAAKDTLR